MGRLFSFFFFLVITVTKLVSSKVYNADTIENVQNHKNQISRTSLIQCGYRYCYSTEILYRKMTGLYCWNKTQFITQFTSISRTCSPTIFNVPITSTVQKKYRPTPIFHRKKKLKQNHNLSTAVATSLKPHRYRYGHLPHSSRPYPSRPTFYVSLTATPTSIAIEPIVTTSVSVVAAAAEAISPTPFTISEKIISKNIPQQQQSNYDFIIVDNDDDNGLSYDKMDNEIGRDNSNYYDADDGMQDNETITDSDSQQQQHQKSEDEEDDDEDDEYEYNDTESTSQDDEQDYPSDQTADSNYAMNQSDGYVQEQENNISDSDELIPSSSNSIISPPPPPPPPPLIQAPEDQMDDNKQEEQEIIPIISAGMQPIIPGAIPTESSIGLPQDPNGNSITTNLNEMAVNNTVPNKALGIGLGVGVGCIAALGLVGLLFHTKKRKQEQQQQQDEHPTRQYTRWRPQSFMGVVASVVSKLPRSPSQRSKASSASSSSSSSSSGRAAGSSSTAAPSLRTVDEK